MLPGEVHLPALPMVPGIVNMFDDFGTGNKVKLAIMHAFERLEVWVIRIRGIRAARHERAERAKPVFGIDKNEETGRTLEILPRCVGVVRDRRVTVAQRAVWCPGHYVAAPTLTFNHSIQVWESSGSPF